MVSCMGLQALCETIPDMKIYLPDVVDCVAKLCQNLLAEGHNQPPNSIQIPIRLMAHVAVSAQKAFIPYLSRTMKLLRGIVSQVSINHFGVHWAALGMMGDCLSIAGKKDFRRFTENTMDQAIVAASSCFTILRSMGFIVLALLAEKYPKRMISQMDKLVPLHFDGILQDEACEESGQCWLFYPYRHLIPSSAIGSHREGEGSGYRIILHVS